ncbi:MAG: ABC transporter substrate-binding protein [Chloroflexi bacterium]|nr:ABC transporter substrate-binding protein [Chloroflexota bacterium]
MNPRGIIGLFLVLSFVTATACTPAAPTPTPTVAKPSTPPPAAATPVKPAASPPAAPSPAATKPAAAVPQPTPAPANVKVGSLQVVSDAGVLIALEKGYFKEQGLNVEVEKFLQVPDMVPPLATAQLDVAMVAMSVAMLAAADRGADVKMVADKGTTQPGFEFDWILLRKDLADSGQVKKPSDLKGMKVAIPSPKSVGEQTIQMMIEEGGLTMNDVEVVIVPLADQPAAFANKAIAASYGVEPNVTAAVGRGFAVKWIPNSYYFSGKLTAAALYYGPNLIKNKDVGQRFMVAYLKGIRDYNKAFTSGEGRDNIVGILAKYTTVKDVKLYDVMEMPYLDPNGVIDRKSIDAQYKWYVDKEVYKGSKTFDDILDTSFAEYAAQKLGKW